MSVLAASLGLGAAVVTFWPVLSGARPRRVVVLAIYPGVWSEVCRSSAASPWWEQDWAASPRFILTVKTHDAASTTAISSLLQWGVESGAIGLALLAATDLELCRLPIGSNGSDPPTARSLTA